MAQIVRAFVLGLVLVSAGCSGGGSSVAVPASLPQTKAALTETATVSLTVPARSSGARARTPSYISPATQSVVVQASPGGTTTLNTPGAGPYSINVPVAPGPTQFFVYAFGGPNASGSLLSNGSTTQTIVQGGNTVNVTLQGVIASITPSYSLASLGPPQVWNANLVARDAALNVISGAYANPIALTNSDVSGHTALSTNTVANSTTTLTLTYDLVGYSGACNYAFITANAAGIPPLMIPFAKGNKVAYNNSDSGAGSVRNALFGQVVNDTIAINAFGTVLALSTLPSITAANVNVCGPGQAAFIIDGTSGGTNGALAITGGTTGMTGLAFANWTNSSTNGGALIISAATNISNVAFTGNAVTAGGLGGAIKVFGGFTLNINNCTFASNSAATGQGGAIFVSSGITANITGSTFVGNSSQQGGAIFNSNGTTNLTNSTLTGNSATVAPGGGYYNSTLGSNGAIILSTFYNNTSIGGGNNLDNSAGGGVVNIQQSIFGSSGGTQDLSGPMGSGGYNVIQNTTGASGLVGSDANITPLLGALTNNGGLTLTMKPLSANVIDRIPAACAAPLDQRGLPRGLDGFCDVGAVET